MQNVICNLIRMWRRERERDTHTHLYQMWRRERERDTHTHISSECGEERETHTHISPVNVEQIFDFSQVDILKNEPPKP